MVREIKARSRMRAGECSRSRKWLLRTSADLQRNFRRALQRIYPLRRGPALGLPDSRKLACSTASGRIGQVPTIAHVALASNFDTRYAAFLTFGYLSLRD